MVEMKEWKLCALMFGAALLSCVFIVILIGTLMWLMEDSSFFHETNHFVNYDSDDVSESIVNLCSLEDGKARVGCVVALVTRFYNYNETDKIRSARETFTNGGDCSDYAYFYKEVFTKLGFKVNFANTDDHIYNIIYGDGFYCNIDQIKYDCHT